MRIVFTLFCLIIFLVPVWAQNSAENKKDKSVISVPIVVSDREGHYIPDLKKEDFSVFQNGVKQEIEFLETFDEPMNVAVLIDTSGSIEDAAKRIKSAAKDFVGLLNSQDKCLIATFDNQVKILNSFTSDKSTLEKSLDQIKSSMLGGTLMYNAVRQVTQKSFNELSGRKAIILLTDGKDFGSSVTKDELLAEFEETDILIYSVFYKTGAAAIDPAIGGKKKKSKKTKNVIIPTGAIYIPTEAEMTTRERADEAEAVDALKKMADATAGRFYQSDAPGLSGIFKRMAGELRQQYRLGFRPQNAANDTTENLIIKVSKPEAVVRFRDKNRSK